MRPNVISGYSTNGCGCFGCSGSSARPAAGVGASSTALWGGITIVNAVLLVAAVYGTWKLVKWVDQGA